MDVLCEPGGAPVTSVRLLAGVESHVRLQVGRRAEAFAALVTRVRFLACE